MIIIIIITITTIIIDITITIITKPTHLHSKECLAISQKPSLIPAPLNLHVLHCCLAFSESENGSCELEVGETNKLY